MSTNNATQSFPTGSITRTEIADLLNTTITNDDGNSLGHIAIFDKCDVRLTDEICTTFALMYGELLVHETYSDEEFSDDFQEAMSKWIEENFEN